jgi:hypothetical protein
MKLRIVLFVVWIVCFFLNGCHPRTTLLFLLREYRHELLLADKTTYRRIQNVCDKNNFTLLFTIIEKNGEIPVKQYIEKTGAGIIFLDSLIMESPLPLAQEYNNRLFLTFRSQEAGMGAKNILSITFDRKEGFGMAGMLTARILSGGIGKEASKTEINIGDAKKAGIIVYAVSEEMNRENEAFISGFSSLLDESKLILRNIDNVNDRVKIKDAMDDMRKEDVVIFFLRAFSLNSYCLDYLRNEGGFAILEEWNITSGYTDVVLLSLHDDIGAIFEGLAANIEVLDSENAVWKEDSFKGHVRIIWGKAIRWPEYLSDRFLYKKKSREVVYQGK